MLKEFRDFIARGNVIDLAVAVIIGAAFGKLVTSLVEGIIMPPIGLMLGGVDFSNLFIDLSGERPISLADAQLKGLPVIAYGQFYKRRHHLPDHRPGDLPDRQSDEQIQTPGSS